MMAAMDVIGRTGILGMPVEERAPFALMPALIAVASPQVGLRWDSAADSLLAIRSSLIRVTNVVQ